MSAHDQRPRSREPKYISNDHALDMPAILPSPTAMLSRAEVLPISNGHALDMPAMLPSPMTMFSRGPKLPPLTTTFLKGRLP
ncbi:hypothetical protein B9D94_29945 [Paenibacillus sp. Cedars]|nr:hypothetical protein B9D94_29945 [Paenibacillus sp. Cedars]